MVTYNNRPKAGDKVERKRRESIQDFNKRKRDQDRRDGKRDYFSFGKLLNKSKNKSKDSRSLVSQEEFMNGNQSVNPNAFPIISLPKRNNSPSYPTMYESYKPNYNQNNKIKTGNILSTLLGLAFPAYGAVKTGSWLANKLINNDTTNNLYDNISFNSLNKRRTEPTYIPNYQDNIFNALNLNTNNQPYYTSRANRPGMFENIVGNNQTTNIVSRPGLYETITDGYQPYLRPNNPANFQDTINANIGLNMGQIYKDIRQPIGNPALSDYSTIFTDSTFRTPTYNTLSLNPNRWADMLNTSRGF
tara:strand:- start:160 stop:1068 length:909 start_codon:yes stop_codon:yes gene_type:complete